METHLCQKLHVQMMTAPRALFVLTCTNSSQERRYRRVCKQNTHTESCKLPLTCAQAAALRLRGSCCSRSFSPYSLPGRVLLARVTDFVTFWLQRLAGLDLRAEQGRRGHEQQEPPHLQNSRLCTCSWQFLALGMCVSLANLPVASLVHWICVPEDKKCMRGSRHLSVRFLM